MTRRPTAALVLVLVSAAAASGAAAKPSGPPGQWTRISETNGSDTDIVGLARTGDGVLHVAWLAREPNFRNGLRHTAVAPNGRVGATNTIATGFPAIGAADLIRAPDGSLRAFFGGLNDPAVFVYTATAPASGETWSLQPGNVTRSTRIGTVGAGLAADGTPVFAWDGLRRDAAYHFGLDPNGPEFRYVEGLSGETCGCPAFPDVASTPRAPRSSLAGTR
jgi:hypothetical protein